jgi:hypothetical protein
MKVLPVLAAAAALQSVAPVGAGAWYAALPLSAYIQHNTTFVSQEPRKGNNNEDHGQTGMSLRKMRHTPKQKSPA